MQIGKFAWWHKEPASVENRVSYQKYLAKVTYKSASDSQCREATVEYWKSKSPNQADYGLESATLQTGNAKLIPCGSAMN